MKIVAAVLIAVAAGTVAACGTTTVTASPTTVPAGQPGASPPTVISPQQAQQAQAQQDQDRVLSSPGWQPVRASAETPNGDGTLAEDWVGVQCSSQPPDTPPNAAIGGNLTITVWNPDPQDDSLIFNQVDFPGGGYSPINPQDINDDTVVAAGVTDVFHTSYTSLVGRWAAGCYISTAGLGG